MRSWVAGFLLCLGSIGHATASPPRLLIEQPIFDFGTVERGTIVEHIFKVRNGGGGSLRIEHVKGTCACTVGAVTGRDVGPDDETWVTVQLDTRELVGETSKTITVYSNDPANPVAGLSLTGRVVADVAVEPSLVYLGRLHRTEATPRLVRVRPGRDGGDARVVRVRAPSFLRTRLVAAQDGEGQQLEISLAPDAPAGRLHADLVLETTSAAQPLVPVPVFGVLLD